MLASCDAACGHACSLGQPLVVQDIVTLSAPAQDRVQGDGDAPEAGPQLRPIQFSTTLSTLEAEQGVYELRVRGWRKFHLLDVRLRLRNISDTLCTAWHVGMQLTRHVTSHIARSVPAQTVMTQLVD